MPSACAKVKPKVLQQVRKLKAMRDQVWALYPDLNLRALTHGKSNRPALAMHVDDIFGQHTDSNLLDHLLQGIDLRKGDRLTLLKQSRIPLHSNAPEKPHHQALDLRRHDGREGSARARSCSSVAKLGISIFYLGYCLGLTGTGLRISSLPDLVGAQSA
ncbi:hypothetical protein [Paracoccus ravus]|uniref:hypothetical protein n=1 Tax=Paracoccus ravus TaxID=2447760 RepID=UPI00106E6FDA|nr:hypothetical protein [Paracoccus ravus]